MLFNSYSFLFGYLPIILTGFFLLMHGRYTYLAKGWLFIGSLIFYSYWNVSYLPLLLGSITFNYFCGLKIMKTSAEKIKKQIFWIGILVNLLLLFYFKYANFFLSNFTTNSIEWLQVILPLGISFFTFTQLAYLVDAYQNKAEHCDWVSYGLFVTIFPHLIAGPILHHRKMIQQFDQLKNYQFNWKDTTQGIFLFVLGLFKKVIIADYLSEFVKCVFDPSSIDSISFVQAWFGAITYSLQLYFDFSGYSDMAIGLGLLFSLHLPINFNSPYQADSIIDFWRRWHITLSTFLRDYLYIPLGGNRAGKTAKFLNLFITMLLGGIWHGAGWTFIAWGACHGTFLIINHMWRDAQLPMSRFLGKAFTLLAVIITWVIFRSPDMSTAWSILEGMFGTHGIILPERYAHTLGFLKHWGVRFLFLPESNFLLKDVLIVGLLSILVCAAPNSNYWKESFQKKPIRWAFSCAFLFVITLINLNEMTEFIYYQF